MKQLAVWKYVLAVRDLTTIQVPKGAEFIHAHEQQGQICLWATVDTQETRREERTFRIAGTGHILTNGKFDYVGTVHLDNGLIVFHVFECK